MVCVHGREGERCCVDCFREAEFAAARAERERCARVVESWRTTGFSSWLIIPHAAKEIRALPDEGDG
jgi:hypothetical protein